RHVHEIITIHSRSLPAGDAVGTVERLCPAVRAVRSLVLGNVGVVNYIAALVALRVAAARAVENYIPLETAHSVYIASCVSNKATYRSLAVGVVDVFGPAVCAVAVVFGNIVADCGRRAAGVGAAGSIEDYVAGKRATKVNIAATISLDGIRRSIATGAKVVDIES